MGRTLKNWLLSGINKVEDFLHDGKFDGYGGMFAYNKNGLTSVFNPAPIKRYELNEDGDYLVVNEHERNNDMSHSGNSTIKDLTEIPESGIVQEETNKGEETNKEEDTNQETNVNGNSTPIEDSKKQSLDWEKIEEIINKGYEREDAIRKETQEREDSAYSRALEDMRKSGINPNLVGITPASSGGGITQASGTNLASQYISNMGNIDTTLLTNKTNKQIALFQAQLQDELKRLELDQEKYMGERKMAIDGAIGAIETILGIVSRFI